MREVNIVIFADGLDFVDPFHINSESVDEGEKLSATTFRHEHFVADKVVDETESFVANPVVDRSGRGERYTQNFGAELIAEGGSVGSFDFVIGENVVDEKRIGEGHILIIRIFLRRERADGAFDLLFGITSGAGFEHTESIFDGKRAIKLIFGSIFLEEGEIKIRNLLGERVGRRLVVVRVGARMILEEHECDGTAGNAEDN